jgi:hypothetical protein
MGFVVGKSMEEGIADVTPTPVLPPSVQDHIGLQLRRSYADLVKEPIPSRLLQLLDELEAKEKKS